MPKSNAHDVSVTGISILVDERIDARFAHTDRVVVAFCLPGQEEPVELAARIRFRRAVGTAIRYGLAYDAERSESFAHAQHVVGRYVSARQEQARRNKF